MGKEQDFMARFAYTFDLDLTEIEILRREFGLTLQSLEKITEEIFDQECIILATCRIQTLNLVLEKCKRNSVIIFLFGNETYNKETFEYLNKYSGKIRFAFMYNFPSKETLSSFANPLLGFIYDFGVDKKEFGPASRLVKNGLDLILRTQAIEPHFPFMEFPQGYSKRFVQELKIRNLINDGESILKSLVDPFVDRTMFMTFTGQKGSWYRQFILELACKHVPDFKPYFTEGWAGANQGSKTNYIDELSKSRFVLNPPGNLTNKTHRYLESLLMGSLPVLPPSTIQDPHHWEVWSEKFDIFSWKKLFLKIQSMDEELRSALVKSALNFEIEKVRVIQSKFAEMVG